MCNKYIHLCGAVHYDFVDPKVNLILIANEKCTWSRAAAAMLRNVRATVQETQGGQQRWQHIVGVGVQSFFFIWKKFCQILFGFYMRQISIGHVLNYGREIVCCIRVTLGIDRRQGLFDGVACETVDT